MNNSFHKQLININLSLLLSFFSLSAFAAIDVYQFKDEEKQHRFQQLTAELRCPKCQNQNLADSNAEIAKDLRTKVYQMLDANKSNDEIVKYMLERYGEFVLYEPRLTAQTFLLWYGPALLLLFGLIVIALIVRYRVKKSASNKNHANLNTEQQQVLTALLNPEDGKK